MSDARFEQEVMARLEAVESAVGPATAQYPATTATVRAIRWAIVRAAPATAQTLTVQEVLPTANGSISHALAETTDIVSTQPGTVGGEYAHFLTDATTWSVDLFTLPLQFDGVVWRMMHMPVHRMLPLPSGPFVKSDCYPVPGNLG